MTNYNGLFQPYTDYKATFTAQVDALVGQTHLTIKERNEVIEALITAYVNETAKVPETHQLERLANFILHEDLTNSDRDKVTNTEFPFLSDDQQKTRDQREMSSSFIEDNTINPKYKANGNKRTKNVSPEEN